MYCKLNIIQTMGTYVNNTIMMKKYKYQYVYVTVSDGKHENHVINR